MLRKGVVLLPTTLDTMRLDTVKRPNTEAKSPPCSIICVEVEQGSGVLLSPHKI